MPNIIPFKEYLAKNDAGIKLAEFADGLEKLPELARRGYRVERSGISEVAIIRNSHVLGVWRVVNGCYLYTPMSHCRATFSCRELSVAILHAQELLILPERISRTERRRN